MKNLDETKTERGNPQVAPPKWRKRRLKTLDDLRRYLADAVHRLEAGQLDDVGVKTRAYVVNVLSSIIKDGDLETRIAALEAAQEER